MKLTRFKKNCIAERIDRLDTGLLAGLQRHRQPEPERGFGAGNLFHGLEAVGRILDELKETFDFIVCDSPAGIESGAFTAMYYADEALIVTNPEVSSVRDSDRILGILAAKSKRAVEGADPVKEHLLVTRYDPKRVNAGAMLSVVDIQEILRIPLLGVIPESESVLQASNSGTPAIHLDNSDVAEAYKDVVGRFMGEDLPMRFVLEKVGFFKRLLGGI